MEEEDASSRTCLYVVHQYVTLCQIILLTLHLSGGRSFFRVRFMHTVLAWLNEAFSFGPCSVFFLHLVNMCTLYRNWPQAIHQNDTSSVGWAKILTTNTPISSTREHLNFSFYPQNDEKDLMALGRLQSNLALRWMQNWRIHMMEIRVTFLYCFGLDCLVKIKSNISFI